jgi:hypothetical protein
LTLLTAHADLIEGLPLRDQQAIFDTEAAHLTVCRLRRRAEARHGLNYAWIVAGPLLALAWLLVTL